MKLATKTLLGLIDGVRIEQVSPTRVTLKSKAYGSLVLHLEESERQELLRGLAMPATSPAEGVQS